MSEIPILYNKNEECTGCTACFAACPKRAIHMIADKEGFRYPVIDKNKCIKCGRCLSVCHIKRNV